MQEIQCWLEDGRLAFKSRLVMIVKPSDTGCFVTRSAMLSWNGLPAGERPCDVVLAGADVLLQGLEGGLDGTYILQSCLDGHPLYVRLYSASHGAGWPPFTPENVLLKGL